MYNERRSIVSPGSLHEVSKKISSGTVSQRYTSAPARVGSFQSVDSVREGSFQPGVLRLNPVTIVRAGGYATSGHYVNRNIPNDWDRTVTGPLAAFAVPANATDIHMSIAPAWDSTLQTRCVQKALVQSKASSDLAMGVALGELSETLRMLRNPLEGLRVFMHESRWLTHLTTRGEQSASLWLEIRYGILPFIREIESILSANDDSVLKPWYRARSTQVIKTTQTVPFGLYGYIYTPYLRGITQIQKTVDYSVKSTAVVYFQRMLEIGLLRRMRFAGLHPSQWTDAAIELIPLSFMAEWFYGLGLWLRALMPDITAKYLGCTVSQVYRTTTTYSVKNPEWSGDNSRKTFAESTIVYNQEALVRKVVEPTAGIPQLNPVSLNWMQSLDVTLISWQRLQPMFQKLRRL